nr:MAG TPA: hypothetical protein [Caudoviricetes sp.]DAW21650.1 MAG TPA: hypothetical protein [Caudoviricetes sp.]
MLSHLGSGETQSLDQRIVSGVIDAEMKLCVLERHS